MTDILTLPLQQPYKTLIKSSILLNFTYDSKLPESGIKIGVSQARRGLFPYSLCGRVMRYVPRS